MHSQAVEHTEGHAPIDIDVAGENKCSFNFKGNLHRAFTNVLGKKVQNTI